MSEVKFVNGMLVKKGTYGIKAGLKVEDLTVWMLENQDEKGWVNIEIKESKVGNWYAKFDVWKPTATVAPNPQNDAANDATNDATNDGGTIVVESEGDDLPF